MTRTKPARNVISKQDVLLIALFLFLVTIFAVGYEAYENSRVNADDIAVEVPPVVVNSLDTQVFERLREMK